jgi:hypothetical protein
MLYKTKKMSPKRPLVGMVQKLEDYKAIKVTLSCIDGKTGYMQEEPEQVVCGVHASRSGMGVSRRNASGGRRLVLLGAWW